MKKQEFSDLKNVLLILEGLRNTLDAHSPPMTLRSALISVCRRHDIDIDYDSHFPHFMGELKELHNRGLIEKGDPSCRGVWSITEKGRKFLEENRSEVGIFE